MARSDLLNVIESYIKQGYSAVQIRQGLISQGWPSSEVDAALSHRRTEESPSKPWVMIWGVVIFLILAIAAALYFFFPSQPTQLLDVSVEPVKTEIIPGYTVDFIVQLVNLGSARRFDVHIKSELVSVLTNEVISTKTETVAIETRNAIKSQLTVPVDAKSGRYVVRVLVEYDTQSARASFTLKVLESVKGALPVQQTGPISQDCPGGCNDYDPCTLDHCSKGACIFDKISPCCGNGVCENLESRDICPDDCAERPSPVTESVQTIINRAIDSSSASSGSGVRLCKTLARIQDQTVCYSGVAKRSGEPDICSFIIPEKDKDSCYLDIALDHDRFDLCDKVIDRWLKSSCYSYANLKKSGQ